MRQARHSFVKTTHIATALSRGLYPIKTHVAHLTNQPWNPSLRPNVVDETNAGAILRDQAQILSRRRHSANQVFIDLAVLHNDNEVLGRVSYQFNILDGVAIDQQ